MVGAKQQALSLHLPVTAVLTGSDFKARLGEALECEISTATLYKEVVLQTTQVTLLKTISHLRAETFIINSKYAGTYKKTVWAVIGCVSFVEGNSRSMNNCIEILSPLECKKAEYN